MSEYRHVAVETMHFMLDPTVTFSVCRDCASARTICTTPTPDPASPCGREGCAQPTGSRSAHIASLVTHPHVPTLCADPRCRHRIEAVR